MQRTGLQLGRRGRRAVVIVQVVVFATLMLGMGALAVDIGAIYTAQTELQRSADSAALAAAARLAGNGVDSPEVLARSTADEYARRNPVAGAVSGVEAGDVVFGQSVYNAGTGKFSFQPGGAKYDAVRIVVRRSAGSAAGPLPLMFANIYGAASQNLAASAAAVLIPRDIAVVIDLSGSMNDDSELQHYKRFQGERGDWFDGIDVNLRDVWCALDGPAPADPYVPGAEADTEYAGDTGPAIGAMQTWGSPVVPETYSPSGDPGLWYIPRSAACTNAAARASVLARGYTADEANCLLSGTYDGTTNQWRNRAAVILGLASWRSGRAGGQPGGDGDAMVDDNTTERVWAAYPSWRGSWTWSTYLTYVSSTSSALYGSNSAFRYRFGVKTFVNWLLESEPQYNQTSVLWQTPEQPIRAVKDAVQTMVHQIETLQSMDQMSLEVFGTTAHHEVNLSETLQSAADRLYHLQSAHYDTTTNMGGGLLSAMNELASARARSGAAKVIVLMSDGKPNVDEHGGYISGGSQAIDDWILGIAQQACDRGIRIYTVSVGRDVDQSIMQAIATTGAGQHFHAEGTPDQYADQLALIFRTLGGKRPVALIE